ncbi:MAG: nucleotidyl transferase AbiEii/AbiGii toxin family protein, partial [Kiritimatiellaeota bacterium]|nr:nucleotidyl transferase AbiEii/AbiGii toxin family protein [Kiritimatiellota bacterium]
MALTSFQRDVCRILAARRRNGGESYVAGGLALNELLHQPRRSRDVDLFHDTEAALAATWPADRAALETAGCSVQVTREATGFVEALFTRAGQTLLIQWSRDSAFRFFPLVEDELLGLTLHPLDLAANKVLALVGRLEPRDWIDVLGCDEKLQPLGYLAWAACGK